MNKLELISALKDRANLTKSEAAEVIKLFFDSLSDAFKNGDRVEIRGFCSFVPLDFNLIGRDYFLDLHKS